MDSESFEGDSRTEEYVEEMYQDTDKIASGILAKYKQYDDKIELLESRKRKLELKSLEQESMLRDQKEIIRKLNARQFILSLALRKTNKEEIQQDHHEIDKLEKSEIFELHRRADSPFKLECSEELMTTRSSPSRPKRLELGAGSSEVCEDVIEVSLNSSQTDLNHSSESIRSTESQTTIQESLGLFIKFNIIGVLLLGIVFILLPFLISKQNEVV